MWLIFSAYVGEISNVLYGMILGLPEWDFHKPANSIKALKVIGPVNG